MKPPYLARVGEAGRHRNRLRGGLGEARFASAVVEAHQHGADPYRIADAVRCPVGRVLSILRSADRWS